MVGLTTRNEASGEQAGSDVRQQLGQRKRAGQKKWQKLGDWGFCFSIFAPNFLYAQAMKFNSIYRRWKRVILSSPGKIFYH
jgi:hypothetical protein